jgi:hypothetical protein
MSNKNNNNARNNNNKNKRNRKSGSNDAIGSTNDSCTTNSGASSACTIVEPYNTNLSVFMLTNIQTKLDEIDRVVNTTMNPTVLTLTDIRSHILDFLAIFRVNISTAKNNEKNDITISDSMNSLDSSSELLDNESYINEFLRKTDSRTTKTDSKNDNDYEYPIIYGGHAQNQAILKKSQLGFYSDDDFHDIEVYTGYPYFLIMNLKAYMEELGIEVGFRNAMNDTTFSLTYMGETVMDISYMPSTIMKRIPTFKDDNGLLMCDPYFMYIDMYAILNSSLNFGFRLEKIFNRVNILSSCYPFCTNSYESKYVNHSLNSITSFVIDVFFTKDTPQINECALTGSYAYNYYLERADMVESNGKDNRIISYPFEIAATNFTTNVLRMFTFLCNIVSDPSQVNMVEYNPYSHFQEKICAFFVGSEYVGVIYNFTGISYPVKRVKITNGRTIMIPAYTRLINDLLIAKFKSVEKVDLMFTNFKIKYEKMYDSMIANIIMARNKWNNEHKISVFSKDCLFEEFVTDNLGILCKYKYHLNLKKKFKEDRIKDLKAIYYEKNGQNKDMKIPTKYMFNRIDTIIRNIIKDRNPYSTPAFFNQTGKPAIKENCDFIIENNVMRIADSDTKIKQQLMNEGKEIYVQDLSMEINNYYVPFEPTFDTDRYKVNIIDEKNGTVLFKVDNKFNINLFNKDENMIEKILKVSVPRKRFKN